MKKNHKIRFSLLLILFMIINFVRSQNMDFYYTFNNEKIYIQKIPNKHLLSFNSESEAIITIQSIPTETEKLYSKSYLVTDIDESNLNQNYTKYPTYITQDGSIISYKNDIVLKFKSGVTSSEINNILVNNHLTLLKSTVSYNQYSTVTDALQISKIIYESGFVEFCHPNFIAEIIPGDVSIMNNNLKSTLITSLNKNSVALKNVENENSLLNLPNDEYFERQWYLHNTGQITNDNHYGTQDADIDAPEAWNITTGNDDIIVAVIDEGVTDNHNDLPSSRQIRLPGSNIAAPYDGFNNPNDPSPDFTDQKGHNHGNACAGIIAASWNHEGIAGIAPNCKIMPIKITYAPSPITTLSDALNFAVLNNANIINCSWGFHNSNPNLYPVIISSINNAISNDIDVVFSAGNTANHVSNSNGYVGFPANSVTEIISVGASDRNNNQANYSPNSTYNLDVVAPSHSAYNIQVANESYNVWTIDVPGNLYGDNPYTNGYTNDIPSPGETLPDQGINFLSYTGRFGGTSAAAPQVAGVLALVRSINNCLDVRARKALILRTADKVGNYNYNCNSNVPGHSDELGYGKLNAHRALLNAQLLNSSTLDLMVKDSNDDLGIQPNTISQYPWASNDIWIRNFNDGLLEHQNPEYSATTPNYAYIRITNKSCVYTASNNSVTLYWAKAGTSLNWPSTWNGSSYFSNDALMGNVIGTVTIPTLAPGEEKIISMPFLVPNPADYNFFGSDAWHFCLLARIESNDDPMTLPETNDLVSNVLNNNNIAWKNVTIVDLFSDRLNGIVAVGNPFNETKQFYLELIKEDTETGKPIYEEAEVSFEMNDVLYKAWERGGKESSMLNDTSEDNKKIVKGNHVILDKISFNPNEVGLLNLSFNFLTKEVTDKSKYTYHVVQKEYGSGKIIGGETYLIKKSNRTLFFADAGGNKEVDQHQTITITASDINENAIYNWYDASGNLVYQGKNLTVSADVITKYKLEVVATSDGYKDYTEVNINFKPSIIESISPNPANENITVNYKLNGISSAYLMVLGSYGNTGQLNNYILENNSDSLLIETHSYTSGFYTIALVCDGQIVDAKTLIKL